jgi:anti-anti-sigma regulatory factor
MSCKINRAVTDKNVVVLSISGGITGEHVDTLRSVLEQEAADALVVDLKSVMLVDREGVKLLALSEANGRELRNCPLYVREWVTRETRHIEDA